MPRRRKNRSNRPTQSNRHRKLTSEKLEDRLMLTADPLVTDVMLRSSNWSDSFIDELPGGGYQVAAENSAVAPWVNLNQVTAQFDGPAAVSSASLYLQATAANESLPEVIDFEYDAETFTATWTLGATLGSEHYGLRIICDDIEVLASLTDPVATYDFDIVQGDSDASGRTDVTDGLGLRERMFARPGDANYATAFDIDGSGAINIFDGLWFRERMFDSFSETPLDLAGPSLTASLANDTAAFGAVNLDGITFDATLAGNVTDPSAVAWLGVSIDGGAFQPLTTGASGSFTFDPTGIADGEHTAEFVALDSFLNRSAAEISFVLDTSGPETPTVLLDPASDTGILGDNSTTTALIKLIGQATGSTLLEVVPNGRTAQVNTDGDYSVAAVPLRLGANQVGVVAYDVAGNSANAESTITREALGSDIILAEGEDFVVEHRLLVPVGEADGARLVRFSVEDLFDRTDDTATTKDVFSVYLVDPANPSETVLDRGIPGTSLLSLTDETRELAPGLVRFDGATVEIDVSSVAGITEAELVLQLIGGDNDSGTQVAVRNLESLVVDQLEPSSLLTTLRTVMAPGDAVDLAPYTATELIDLQVSNVRFDTATGTYAADVRISNQGASTGRRVIARFPSLPSGVQLLNASGIDGTGVPFISFTPAIVSGGLIQGTDSRPVLIEFSNPDSLRFDLIHELLTAGENSPPTITTPQNLSVLPGHTEIIDLQPSDLDGDRVTLTLNHSGAIPRHHLAADGKLSFTPSPSDVGTYQVDIVASDGSKRTTRSIQLEVPSDPVQTTRISGVILNTDGQPLANVPIELGSTSMFTNAQGEFRLETPVAFDSDVLVVHGEAITGVEVYPYIAEKLPLLFKTGPFESADNVVVRPIYLPVLDLSQAETIDPNSNVVVSANLTDGEAAASVQVAAGSLMTQSGGMFTGQLSITEVPIERTPAALPEGLFPGAVVTIQPGEMVFTTPAPLALPNRGNLPAGTQMDLWSINPESGEFEIVGLGVVSADGTIIETVEGGIRNSSWHFFAVLSDFLNAFGSGNSGAAAEPETRQGTDDCGNDCGAKHETRSAVELFSGAYLEDHDFVSYQSLGTTQGLRLEYNSNWASAQPIIEFHLGETPQSIANGPENLGLYAMATISRGDVAFEAPGDTNNPEARTGEYLYPINDRALEGAFQLDLSTLPTGVFQYDLEAGIRFGSQGASTNLSGEILHVNSVASEFGAGWMLADVQRFIRNPNGSLLLVDGDGATLVFEVADDGTYVAPVGDFSEVEINQDLITRTMKDGTVYEFDARDRLSIIRDRNGNEVQHVYDLQDRITELRDAVGLKTRIAYNNGQITIIDPAERTTTLHIDERGDLVAIDDPDGTRREFSYDASHRMITEVNKRGHEERVVYDDFGRVSKVILPDGNEHNYSPVETQLLSNPILGDGAVSRTGLPTVAFVVDQNGNIETQVLDSLGQTTTAIDNTGLITSVARNEDNLVSQVLTGGGARSEYSYDGSGNLISSSDIFSRSIAANVGASPSQFDIPDHRPFDLAFGSALLSADIDSDSNAEVIVSIRAGVSILDSTDNSQEPFSIETTRIPNLSANTVADVNNDGFLDLIGSGPRLSFGDGEGGFSSLTQVGNHGSTFGIRTLAGDFNEDGIIDLAEFGEMYIGDGTGSFMDPSPLEFMDAISAIGDFDGDGHLDIATNGVQAFGDSDTSVAIFYGLGDGTFSDAIKLPVLPVAGRQLDIRAGDFDGDGTSDIAVAYWREQSTFRLADGGSIVYFGTSARTFTDELVLNTKLFEQTINVIDSDDSSRSGLAIVSAEEDLITVHQFGTDRQLSSSHQLPVGDNPSGAVTADLNNDGKLELLTINQNSGDITQLPLSPSSAIATTFAISDRSNAPDLMVDVDNDGLLDALFVEVTGAFSGFIIHRGQLNGSFGDAETINYESAGYAPVSTGDFNGDGAVDLLFHEPALIGTDIRLYLNDGSGQFTSGESYRLGSSRFERVLTISDIDSDGFSDVLWARSENTVGLSIRYGSGEGTLGEVVSYDLSQLTNGEFIRASEILFTSDSTGDEIPDIVFSANRIGAVDPGRAVLTLVGTDEREYATQLAVTDIGDSVVIDFRDVNGDVFPDFATRSVSGSDIGPTVKIFHNQIDGAFSEQIAIATGAGIAQVPLLGGIALEDYDIRKSRSVDINGDSFADLIVEVSRSFALSVTYPSGLLFYMGTESGDFQFEGGYYVGGPFDFFVEEFTDDIFPDIVITDDNQVRIIAGKKDFEAVDFGRYTIDSTSTRLVPITQRPRFVFHDPISPDVNGDGAPDLIGGTEQGLSVLFGPFTDSLITETELTDQSRVGSPTRLAYDSNFNQLTSTTDELGRQALFEIDPENGNTLSVTEVVGEKVQIASTASGGHTVGTAYADFNADGITDVVVANRGGAGSLRLLLGNEEGAFQAATSFALGDISSVTTSDFDGDGNADIAYTEDHPTDIRAAVRVFVAYGDGAGAFAAPVELVLPETGIDRVPTITTADLNGDGRSELLIAHGLVTIAYNDGNGGFNTFVQPELPGALSGFARQVVVADLDGEHGLDVVVATSAALGAENSGGRVFALLDDGNDGFNVRELAETTGNPEGLAIGDWNGDGVSDLAVAGTRSQLEFGVGEPIATHGIWLMTNSGDGTSFSQSFLSVTETPTDIASVDLDLDGDDDLAYSLTGGTVVVRLNANGNFATSFSRSTPESASSIQLADLDGDQDLDALVGSGTSQRLSVVSNLAGGVGGNDDIVTRFTYTSRGQIDTATDELGRLTDYDYDPFGRLERVTYAVGTPEESFQLFAYDGAGNNTLFQDENGNVTRYAYDAHNRLTQVTEPDPDGPAGPLLSPVTRFGYDATGNLTTTTDAEGNTTTNLYDPMDRLVVSRDADFNETLLRYDAAGNLVLAIDPLGNRTENSYDARNRLVKTIDPDGGETTFQYDLNNNLTSLTDPIGNRTQFFYDARDRLIREIDPLGKATTYVYDSTDNLIEKIDRNGRVTEFNYDDLDRLRTEIWVDGGNVVDYSYDAVGNLLTVSDAFSALTFTYDSRDRVKTVDNAGTPDAPNVALTYGYDGVGNVTSVMDVINGVPGATTTYDYDALNRTTLIQQSGESVSEKAVEFLYNQLGQFDEISRYSDLGRGNLVAKTDYEYDQLNRLTDLDHTNALDEVLAFYDFDYDSASRITRIADIDGITDYTYDDRSQLTGADRAAGDARGDETYDYDANGNRESSHLHGSGYVTGDGNRLLSDGTYNYEYDNEGNTTRRTEIGSGDYREFAWDHRNRLVQVTDYSAGGIITLEVGFAYDALGRRILKTVDLNGAGGGATALHFIYDREDVMLDFADADGVGGAAPVLDQRYLHGPGIDQVLAQEAGGGTELWYLTDHLGTTRDLTDSNGQLIQHLRFDSFGQLLGDTTPLTRHQFAGREYDGELGLYFFRTRYYDARIGRFVSDDPLGLGGEDANFSRYVDNSPLNYLDTNGLAKCKLTHGGDTCTKKNPDRSDEARPTGPPANFPPESFAQKFRRQCRIRLLSIKNKLADLRTQYQEFKERLGFFILPTDPLGGAKAVVEGANLLNETRETLESKVKFVPEDNKLPDID